MPPIVGTPTGLLVTSSAGNRIIKTGQGSRLSFIVPCTWPVRADSNRRPNDSGLSISVSSGKGLPVLERVRTYCPVVVSFFSSTVNRAAPVSVKPCLRALVAIPLTMSPKGTAVIVPSVYISIFSCISMFRMLKAKIVPSKSRM